MPRPWNSGPALAAALLLLVALSIGPAQAAASSPPAAAVSILPQAYLLERIMGPGAGVEVLVGPGQEPHSFAPTPRQLASLSQARLYFLAGLPFEERLVGRLQQLNPDMRVVNTLQGMALNPGGDQDHHHEAGPDPHTWLDPRLASRQASTMARALSETDPQNIGRYAKNLAALQADLDALNRETTSLLAPCRGRTMLVLHPAFGYFAQAYGLKQEAIQHQGKAPHARQMAQLIEQIKAQGGKVVFVEPQFPQRSARAVAQAIDGEVVVLDPLPRDYLAGMRELARQVASSLGCGAAR